MSDIIEYPKIKKKKSGKSRHGCNLTSEFITGLWKNPETRKKYIKACSKPKNFSPEELTKRSDRMRENRIRGIELGLIKPFSKEQMEKLWKASMRARLHSCPFTMVDGVNVDVVHKDRYNTHSGVITESEAREIRG